MQAFIWRATTLFQYIFCFLPPFLNNKLQIFHDNIYLVLCYSYILLIYIISIKTVTIPIISESYKINETVNVRF